MKFHLGVHYYKFKIFCFFFKTEAFFPLVVFTNDILSLSSGQFFSSSVPLKGEIFNFFFHDSSVFIEKKTNIGFYNVRGIMGFQLSFSNFFFFFCNFFFLYLKVMHKGHKHSFALIMLPKRKL
jgi:hypothetical protein